VNCDVKIGDHVRKYDYDRIEVESFAMKKNSCVCFFVVLVLFLAQNTVYGLDGQSVVSQDAAEPEVFCPGDNFLVFLAKFVDDEITQRTFTIYPLTYLEVDYFAEPVPKPFIRYLDCGQVKFPVFPPNQERKEDSLEIRIINVSNDNAKVAVVKPDTGYNIIYYFRKNDSWRLERIEDWSC
jgi:hypothetical protein